MRKFDSPVISVPGRLDYFPPISSPATMFQKRKKKSAREVYRLSPQTHDLVLQNPPVTPWDEPPEFFRTFIGTPDDIKNGADLRTTWPFLRQLGPKCTFKGMRKKAKDPDDDHHAYLIEIANAVNSKFVNVKSLEDRLLEPECIGIGSPRPRVHIFTTYTKPQNAADDMDTDIEHSQEGPGRLRSALSVKKVKAPPPSENRSTKSDDSESSPPNRLGDVTPANRVGHVSFAPFDQVQTTRAFGSTARKTGLNLSRYKYLHVTGEQFVNFKKSPLPERLQHLQDVLANHSDPTAAEMCKLTWRDIMQARTARTRADDATRKMSAKHVEVTNQIQTSWRLPAPRVRRGTTLRVVDREQQKRDGDAGRIDQRDIATWLQNVSKAQIQTRAENKDDDTSSPQLPQVKE